MFDQLDWIRSLGGCKEHLALLVADADVDYDIVLKARVLASESFTGVWVIATENPVQGWIPGSCALFKLAAKWAYDHQQPWLWLEPDAIPLIPHWLDKIEDSYRQGEKPFMGTFITHQQQGLPSPYMEGVAVYPANAIELMGDTWGDRSWTFACAKSVVPKALDTPLIHHIWGIKDIAPTFAVKPVAHTRVFCLDQIRKQAVIFHRCKDGSLTRLLRVRAGLEPERSTELLVVFPFCGKDALMFISNIQWMKEVQSRYNYELLLSYDETTNNDLVQEIRGLTGPLFRSVRLHKYPKVPLRVWPPTWAFIQTAKHVQETHRGPWLWHEYDAIPLKAGWVEALEAEYYKAGKDFMGPIVPPPMGHMNGTGIYPWNTPQRIPKALTQLRIAWDVAMKEEMIANCHDCKNVLQHAWIMQNGRLLAYGNGVEPSFRTNLSMGMIIPTAYVFHRCKDGTLIQRLKERKMQIPKT